MMATLSCPLCCQPNFSSVDLLRASLISVTNRPLICPICNDVLQGLEKLATHLSKHIQIPTNENYFDNTINEHHQNDVKNVVQNGANHSQQIVTSPGIDYAETENNVKLLGENTFDNSVTRELLWPRSPEIMNPTIQTQSDHDHAPFNCHLCGSTFRSHQLQQMHMQLVHEIHSNRMNCAVNSTLDKSQDSMISTTTFQCYLCPKRFKMIGSLRLHVRMLHGVSRIPQKVQLSNVFTCGGSGDQIQAIGPNQTQLLSDLSDEIISSAIEESPIITNTLMTTDQTECFRSFSSVGATESVIESRKNSGFIKNEDKSGDNSSSCASSSNNNETSIGAEDRLHECDICSKRFTTKYFLKKHKRLHTGETPYTCEICNRTFTFQQSYHRHLSYHTNERPHNCMICGRAFKELSTLHNHERIHSGEKPFKCETCGKCFRQRVSYLVHHRIHTGVMPYNCTTCDKKFRYKISLKTHKCTGFVTNEIQPLESTLVTTLDKIIKSKIDDAHNDLQCSQTLDAFITESCNRMGIVDPTESHPIFASSSGNEINHNNHHHHQSTDLDPFNLNDLPFAVEQLPSTAVVVAPTSDLANVLPTMSEIFPQTLDMINELYDNVTINSNDLEHLYESHLHK